LHGPLRSDNDLVWPPVRVRKDKGRIRRLLRSWVLLKCPGCCEGTLFYGLFSMHQNCPLCSLKFEREQGYFVGAIYLNYAATVAVAVPGYFFLDYLLNISLFAQLVIWIAFTLVFPLLFFRHSRSLWLALDTLFNPVETPVAGVGEPPSRAGKVPSGDRGQS